MVPGDDLVPLDGNPDGSQHYEPDKDDHLAYNDNMAGIVDDEENDSSFNDKEGTEGMDDAGFDNINERKKTSRKSGKNRDKSDRKERKKHKRNKKESRRLRKNRDIGEAVPDTAIGADAGIEESKVEQVGEGFDGAEVG